jgi:hypothetical protein
MLHDNGHLQLLPNNTIAPAQIHLYEIKRHPGQDHQQIQTKKKTTLEGIIYITAKQGMSGLPQSGLLASKLFEKQLTNTVTDRANWCPAFGDTTHG